MRATDDQLRAIWTLCRTTFPFQRVARLDLPTSRTTIRRYYQEACRRIASGDLIITPKGEGEKNVYADPKSLESSDFRAGGGAGTTRAPTRIRKPDDEWNADKDW